MTTYYERNKEKIKARQDLYIKNNKEKVLKQKREWATKHRKELRAKGLMPPTKKELIEKIDKAIEYIKGHNIIGVNKEYLPSGIEKCYGVELLEILGDKENDKN